LTVNDDVLAVWSLTRAGLAWTRDEDPRLAGYGVEPGALQHNAHPFARRLLAVITVTPVAPAGLGRPKGIPARLGELFGA